MRFALLIAAGLALLACTPGGSPAPEVGGQTGDPGVKDFISIDPGAKPPEIGGGASCLAAVTVLSGEGPSWWADSRHQAARLGAAHVVLFDEARGLAVVDVSQAEPQLVGRLPLPRSAGQLHVVGQQAFIARRNVRDWASPFADDSPAIGHDAELLAVDLSEPAAPKLLNRLPLQRAPRTSMLVASGGTTRIYVLSDDGVAWSGCGGRDRSVHLTSFGWSNGKFEQRSVLTLVDDYEYGLTVAPLDDKLLLVRHHETRAVELSVIALSASDGSMVESERVPAQGVIRLHRDAQNLVRALTWRENNFYLDVYDLSDVQRPKLQSHCALPKDNVGIGGDPATFSPRHVFFRSGHRGDGNNNVLSVAFAADGSCEVRSYPGRMRGLGPVGGRSPDRVLDVQSNESGGLSLRLLRDADLSVVSELTVPSVAEAWLAGATVLSAANSTLLWLGAYDPDGVNEPYSLFLVEVVGDTLRARGSVRPAASLLKLDTSQTLVWSDGKLARVDLTDLDRPRLSRALDVTPSFSHVLAFDTHWARLRTPHERESREELTADELFSNTKGSIELVPIARDPDLDDDTAKVEANPFGRLVRVGSLLVSVASGFKEQVVGPPRDQGPQPTLFEVFDLSDTNAPKRTGELRIAQLSQPLPCTYCTGSALDSRDLVVPNALVLRVHTDAGQLGLRVLDLSDPAHPSLSEPIARPESEPILGAFSVGSNIYYSYRERVTEGSADPERARFYFRKIDLSDVQAPRVGERVNIPGQLVAVREEAAYSREFTRTNGTLNTYVHRLGVANERAKVEASHEVGTRSAVGIELDGSGHLLLDLRAPLQSFLYGTWTSNTPTDLRVLDANTLQLLGEGPVGLGATRLGVQGARAFYGAAQGVILMDLSQPAAPRAQAYLPTWIGGSPRGIVTDDAFVIEDSGALKRYPLDYTNLP